MQCGVALCGHCQLGPLLLCRDGPVLPHDQRRGPPRRPGALSDGTQAQARRLEVRLVRRLPADAARLRGRAPADRRRGRDRVLPRGHARHRARALRPLARRGLGDDAARRRAHPARCGASRARWSRSARAPPRAASRRCATSRTSTTSCRSSTRRPSYVSTLATSTPISAHVPVDFELQGCPIDKRQLLEVLSAFLNGREPRISAAERVRRVQAPRQRVRDGRPRHALPRARHARRLRRDLPVLRPRLLRLLRAQGDAQHGLAGANGWRASARRERELHHVFRTFNAARPEFQQESEAHEQPR